MQFLTDWISNIILLILLATILELLLPNSSLQRYVKMVVGLLLLVILLNPLFTIFSRDADSWVADLVGVSGEYDEKNVQISMENKKKEIQQAQLAYISEQVAVQLKRQVEEELITKFNKGIAAVNVVLDDFYQEDYINSILKVSIQLTEVENGEQMKDGVETVALVSIDTTTPIGTNNEQHDMKEMRKFLGKQWQLPIDKIEVLMEGRERK